LRTEIKHKTIWLSLIILLIGCLILNICLGSINIPLKSIWAIFTQGDIEKESWRLTLINIRLPKAFTAILVGSGLSLSGLLMQTLFRNPLSGPFVIGLSSGASLGVALVIMGSTLTGSFLSFFLNSSYTLVIAASLGSLWVLVTVMSISHRIKDSMSILIIGLMFGSLSGALVNVLTYFSHAEKLKQFMLWSLGSLGNLNLQDLIFFSILIAIGILLSVYSIKPLNALLLGENYAKSMGLRLQKSRYLIIIATSFLAGSCTAFVGPIAFIGIAVPHITRMLFNTTNHKILIPSVCIIGSLFMLICDTIAQVPTSEITLPINAITSFVGAPVVIWLLVRKQKIFF